MKCTWILVLLLTTSSATGQERLVAAPEHFIFSLEGSQEVPPVPSPATGGCMGQFDEMASELVMTCNHNVQDATAMHIHVAPPGANGPIAFDFGDPTSGSVQETWMMTPTDVANLLAGDLYVNVHPSGRPAGELRGQVQERTADSIFFLLESSQQVPPDTTTTATGSCLADLSDDATMLSVECIHNVAQTTGAHIHRAPLGENGPPVFTFNDPVNPSGTKTMTPSDVADFVGAFLYVNVHAPPPGQEEDPSGDPGQLRGQMTDTPIFSDGFESGDTLMWSSTVP